MVQGTLASYTRNESDSSFVVLGRGDPRLKICVVNEYEMKSKTTFEISIITKLGKM
jgi:hypothetical protein